MAAEIPTMKINVSVEHKAFDEWAIIDLFGHQRIAGRVSEQTIGGCSFVRVDVPGSDAGPAFTRLFGSAAIYSINVTDEETARMAARDCIAQPMGRWSGRAAIEAKVKAEKTRAGLLVDDTGGPFFSDDHDLGPEDQDL